MLPYFNQGSLAIGSDLLRRKSGYGNGGTVAPLPKPDQPNINVQPYQPYIQPPVEPAQQPQTGGGPQPPRPFVPPNPFEGGGPNVHPTAPEDNPQKNISDSLLQQLMSFIGNPSRYNQDIVDKRFEHQRDVLGKGFDVQRQRTMEDAAKRGLFYSTEPTGRMGDIAGQQAQAEAGMLSDLTTDQAKTHAEDMQRAIQTILGFSGQQFGQQQATAQMNMLQDEQMRNFLLQLLGGSQ